MIPDISGSLQAADSIDLTAEKARRKTLRDARYAEVDAMNHAEFQKFMKELLGAGLADGMLHVSCDLSPTDRTLDVVSEGETEEEREARVEDSRRKMAELERDQPIWEAAKARRKEKDLNARQNQEAMTQHDQVTKAHNDDEIRPKEGAATGSSARDKEQTEKKEKEKEEERRRAIWALYQAEIERKRFEARHWTRGTALHYYTKLSKEFDAKSKGKLFGANAPLSFHSVPWPMLVDPRSSSVSDITWETVEEFLSMAEKQMTEEQFNRLLVTSQRRFHDDRWRNWGLFESIPDSQLRIGMEKAVKMV